MGLLTPIGFDIETTGLGADAVVTVVGIALPDGCRVFLHTDGRPIADDSLASALSATFEISVSVRSFPTESSVLEAVTVYAAESLNDQEYLLVAYNGERYQGGFDLPFLRTRYASHGIPWPFALPYADVMTIVDRYFNTTRGVTDDNGAVMDLESVYQLLVSDGLTDLDPFASSDAAVQAFETGDFRQLLQHNVADILRTRALGELAEQYCGKSDFNMKSLTPPVNAYPGNSSIRPNE